MFQHYVVSTPRRANTTSCKNDFVSTQHRFKTIPCVSTASCKFDVVSKNSVASTRHSVNMVSCQNGTVSGRRCVTHDIMSRGHHVRNGVV